MSIALRGRLALALLWITAQQAPAAPSSGGGPSLHPASPKQGDTLFAVIRPGSDALNVTCTWDGRGVPVARAGESALATIGIRITERAGPHSLKLKVWSANGAQRVESHSVTVQRTAWPVQRLRMRRSTEKLYTFPGAKAEDAAVTRATRTVSDAMLWQGRFILPTKGRTSTPFGVKRIRNNRTHYHHRGLDIAADTGTPVHAANAGRVVLARDFIKYGNTVVLDHGLGVTTLYLHMSALAVREGETVPQGQLIGRVGAEGVATGPHLHWSLYVHGNSVSPLFWTRLPESVTHAVARRGTG